MEKWLTPEGVKTGIEFVIVLMSAVTAVLALMGKKDAAAKLEDAKDTIEKHEDTITNATKTTVALVQGIEAFRQHDDTMPEQSAALKASIMDATKAMNVEHIVLPLVKAVTEGNGSVLAALVSPNPTSPVVAPAPNPPNP